MREVFSRVEFAAMRYFADDRVRQPSALSFVVAVVHGDTLDYPLTYDDYHQIHRTRAQRLTFSN